MGTSVEVVVQYNVTAAAATAEVDVPDMTAGGSTSSLINLQRCRVCTASSRRFYSKLFLVQPVRRRIMEEYGGVCRRMEGVLVLLGLMLD